MEKFARVDRLTAQKVEVAVIFLVMLGGEDAAAYLAANAIPLHIVDRVLNAKSTRSSDRQLAASCQVDPKNNDYPEAKRMSRTVIPLRHKCRKLDLFFGLQMRRVRYGATRRSPRPSSPASTTIGYSRVKEAQCGARHCDFAAAGASVAYESAHKPVVLHAYSERTAASDSAFLSYRCPLASPYPPADAAR